MELQHVNVKIFVAGAMPVDLARFIEVFHAWTADQSMPEMLIDVADYRHVPAGPGVVLVGHEADYGMDNAGDRLGLLYNRKAPVDGSNADRFRQALHGAAQACLRLEEEIGEGLRFSRTELQLLVNDRAFAPNTPATHEACVPEIRTFFAGVFGHNQFQLAAEGNPRRRFGVMLTSATDFDLATF